MSAQREITDSIHRRSFIGGSDARIIMGTDEATLLRLWRCARASSRSSADLISAALAALPVAW